MASYAQIKARIEKLEKEAQQLLRKEAVKAIDTIKRMMDKYQITLADLGAAVTDTLNANDQGRRTKSPATNGRRGKKAARQKPAAKYQNPKTGDTWSGMGRPPAWISDAVAKGKQDKFLIGVAAGTKPLKAAGKSSVAAKQPRGKVTTKAPGKATAKPAVKAKKAAKSAAPKAAKAPAPKRGRKPGAKAAAKATSNKKASAPATKVSDAVASAAAE
jgi:DNA-binding protein H-NS